MTVVETVRMVCIILVALSSCVGVGLFVRACATIAARMRIGRPLAPSRLRPVLPRLGALASSVLMHRSFQGRPWVRLAHWLVMVSFPLLFLTLVTGYGQVLGSVTWSLPLLGHAAWWAWVVEFFAFTSLLGIIGLMILRARLRAHGYAQPPFAESGTATRPRTSRFASSTSWQARVVEWVVAGVVACVLILRICEAALEPGASWTHYPLTFWPAQLLSSVSPTALSVAIIVVATIKVLISMSWFVVVGLQPTMGVAWHRFLAFITVYARRTDAQGQPGKSLGPLEPIMLDGAPLTADRLDDLDAAMEAAEESEGPEVLLGVERIEQFTWKGLLDFSTCTECGRCQDLCPAWNTGKPLSPKLLVQSLRDHHAAVAPFLQAAQRGQSSLSDDAGAASQQHPTSQQGAAGSEDASAGSARAASAPTSAHSADVLGALLAAKAAPTEQGVATTPAPLVGNVITPDVLWSCTTCGACVDQCPVDIDHIDRIIDMRREQVLMASAFPKELGTMFRKLESKSNPWGLPPRKRMAWAQDCDFEVPVIGIDVEDASEVDYLFWVGCAGSYEDRAKRTTRAVAELLHLAGVSYAVLGDGESCTGDPARRAGNELLFQMLAAATIETLNEVKAQRIVVTCAHCFNTMAREYPDLGGRYEVIHHTQLLGRLVREGALTPVAPPAQAQDLPTVTYHDACYLGRHNQVYTPPRELIEATGAPTVEMPRHAERAMCCGGGGARAFMEESLGTRISQARSREALDSGAQVIATACPFCTTMLSDGVAAQGGEARVVDVATLMLEAVHRGQQQPAD